MLKHKIVDFIIQYVISSNVILAVLEYCSQVHGGSGQGNQRDEVELERAGACSRRVIPPSCAYEVCASKKYTNGQISSIRKGVFLRK